MRKIDLTDNISNQQLLKEFKRTAKKRKRWTFFGRIFSFVVVMSAILVLISVFWFPVYHISGSAMKPTLEEGMVVIASRIDRLDAGDIAAMYYENNIVISRLIGMPGDSIYIDGQGRVSVNGVLLYENYLNEIVLGTTDLTYPYQIPTGRYFVMGDNRAESTDSRMSVIGCIDEKKLIGKVIFCVWPLGKMGYIR